MEINQYIKELLLLNDCVIIPEFGGFVANYKPASVHNNQFSAPTKEVAFNNKLVSNDGLLINYIAQAERIDYFDAKQKVESFVEDTILNLEKKRNIYFEGIGYLHYDSRENLLFEPQVKENLLVESYGLQSFSYEKLYQRQMPAPAIKIERPEALPVIFEKRKIKKLVVAVPLLLAMALIPLKNNKEYLSKSDMGMLESLMEAAPATASATPEAADPTTAQYTEQVKAEVARPFTHYIIGGSFKSEENANKYMQQLQEKGITGMNLGVYHGLHRIAIKGFYSEEEAQKELNVILHQSPGSGAWIAENE
ncbi:MAG: SPOR domain-containing protein [Candidatus Saccharibacteria bacterium]